MQVLSLYVPLSSRFKHTTNEQGPANALDPEQYTDASRPVTPIPTSVPMGGIPSVNVTPIAPDRKGKAVEVDDGGYEDLDLGVRQ